MTELEKMASGALYDFSTPEVASSIRRAARLLERFNRAAADDDTTRRAALEELIPGIPASATVIPPFFCDHGTPIRLGEGVFVNTGCTMLDSGGIAIGPRTLVGPACKFFTPQHPLGLRRAAQARGTGFAHRDRRRLLAGRQRDGLPRSPDRRPFDHRGRERRRARHSGRLAGRGQPRGRQTQTESNTTHMKKEYISQRYRSQPPSLPAPTTHRNPSTR